MTTYGRSVLLISYLPFTDKDLEPELDKVMDGFNFENSMVLSADERLARLDADSLEQQAHLVNATGLYFFERQNYQRAKLYFKRAFELTPTKLVYFKNALACFSMSGDFNGGLRYIEGYPSQVAQSHEIASWKAYLLGKTGQHNQAIELYHHIFMEGYRSDDDLRDYLKLLKAAGNLTLAGEVLDHYLQEQMVLEFALERAEVFSAAEQYSEGLAYVKQLEQSRPFDADLAVKIIEFEVALSQFDDAIVRSNVLIQKRVYLGTVTIFGAKRSSSSIHLRKPRNL